MNYFEAAYTRATLHWKEQNMSDKAYEQMALGTYRVDTSCANRNADARYLADAEDTTAVEKACRWMERCRKSEDEAFDVAWEVEIAEHGNFVKRAMHLLSGVGTYTDRNKIVSELVAALEETLLEIANRE